MVDQERDKSFWDKAREAAAELVLGSVEAKYRWRMRDKSSEKHVTTGDRGTLKFKRDGVLEERMATVTGFSLNESAEISSLTFELEPKAIEGIGKAVKSAVPILGGGGLEKVTLRTGSDGDIESFHISTYDSDVPPHRVGTPDIRQKIKDGEIAH